MSKKPGAYIIALFGQKHTGKSTLARAMIARAQPPVYILDPKHEYPGQTFSSVEQFLDAAKADRLAGGIYAFRLGRREEAPALFAMAGRTGGTLVVEEAHMWCNPSYIDESLKDAIFFSAHAGLDQIYISQRSASIHNHIISQADCIVSFRQTLDADINRLKSRLSNYQALRELDTGDYLQTDPFPARLQGLSVDL